MCEESIKCSSAGESELSGKEAEERIFQYLPKGITVITLKKYLHCHRFVAVLFLVAKLIEIDMSVDRHTGIYELCIYFIHIMHTHMMYIHNRKYYSALKKKESYPFGIA